MALSVKDFSARIKSKYPEYKDIEDTELATRIVEKYPEYKSEVDFGAPVVAAPPIAPAKTATPAAPTPSVLPSLAEKAVGVVRKGVDAMIPNVPKTPLGAVKTAAEPLIPDVVKTDIAKRGAGDVMGGAVGSAGSMVGMIPAAARSVGIKNPYLTSVPEKAAMEIRRVAQEFEPENPNIGDMALNAVGSMALFWGTGLGTGAAISQIPRLGKVATVLAYGAQLGMPTIMESATEGGDTYISMVEGGTPPQEAAKAAQKTFLANIMTVGITNALGIGGKYLQGVKKHLMSMSLEGLQEGAQSVIQDASQGKPINWLNAFTSATVGGLVGGPTSMLFDLATETPQQATPAEGAAGVQPAAQTAVPPVIKPEPAPPAQVAPAVQAQQQPTVNVAQGGISEPVVPLIPEQRGTEDAAVPPAPALPAEQAAPAAKTTPTFEQAVKKLPKFIGGYDVMGHKTTEDLAGLVEFELDLYGDPNEDSDIKTPKQAAAAKKYLAWLRGETVEPGKKNQQQAQQKKPQAPAKPKKETEADILNAMRQEIESGKAGSRVGLKRESEMGPGKGKMTGEFISDPSTFPEYFKNKGLEKKEILNIIDKRLGLQKLTAKQQEVLDTLLEERERFMRGRYEQYKATAARLDKEASIKRTPVGDLNVAPGEKIEILKDGVIQEVEVTDVSESGSVTLSTGETLDVFDTVDMVDQEAVKRSKAEEFLAEEEKARQERESQDRAERALSMENFVADSRALAEVSKKQSTSKTLARGRMNEIKEKLISFNERVFPEDQAAKFKAMLDVVSDPNSLVKASEKMSEAFEKLGKVEQTESTKATIERTTGVDPIDSVRMVKETLGLKDQLQRQAKASKEGFREGRKVTKEELLNKFRAGKQRVEEVVDYIKQNLPLEERGRLISKVLNAETAKRQFKAFAAANDAIERVANRKVESEIKNLAEPPKSVDVQYQKQIFDLVKNIDFKKMNATTASKLKALANFIQVRGKQIGLSPEQFPQLRRLGKVALKNMPYSEKLALMDELERLTEMGKLKRQLKNKYEQRAREAGIKRLVDSTQNMDPKKGKDEEASRIKTQAIRTYLETIHTPRAMDALDGYADYKGENVKHVKELGRLETLAKREQAVRTVDTIEKIKAVKADWTEQDQVAIIYHLLMEQGAETQAKALLKAKDLPIPPIKTKEIGKVMDIAREAVGSKKFQIAAIYEEITNTPFEMVKNYFPIKYEKEFNVQPDELIQQGRFRKTNTEQGFTKSRKEDVKKIPRTDFFGILEESIADQEWYVHMQPKLEDLKYLVKSKAYQESAGEIASSLWSQVLDVVARRGWAATAKANPILRRARINLGNSIIGYKLSSVLMQPFALIDAMAYAGTRLPANTIPKIWAEFIKTTANPWYADAYIKSSPALMERQGGELGMEEAFEASSKRSRFFQKIIKGGMAPLQKADVLTAASVQQAIEKVLRQQGVKNAKTEAEFLMNLVSGNSMITYRPLVLSQGEWARTLFTFQNFIMNRFGIIFHDLIKSGVIKGSLLTKTRALTALALIMAGKIAEDFTRAVVYEFTTGGKAKVFSRTFKKDALTTAMFTIPTSVPLFGNAVEAVWNGYGAGRAVPVVKAAEDILRGTFTAFTGAKRKTRRRSAIRAAEGVSSLVLGIPGTGQAFDIAEKIFGH